MRIPIDLLPPIESLPGSFRRMDCFACVWCVFTDCSVEQRSEMEAASRDGVKDRRVITIVQKLYPEYIWSWNHYKNGGIPRDLLPGQAAFIIYETSPHLYHFTILMNRGGVYESYDPQSLRIAPFDCLREDYSILNAYIPRSVDLFEGKLSPRRIKYQFLSERPNPQAEQHQIYYSILHYLRRARQLFTDADIVEDDIEELREIGNFINKVNDMKMVGRDQKGARRALNDIYARHYTSLLGWRPEELVSLDRRVKLKSTNYMTSVRSQKPTKQSFTRSKRNSARERKSKRRKRRNTRTRPLTTIENIQTSPHSDSNYRNSFNY